MQQPELERTVCEWASLLYRSLEGIVIIVVSYALREIKNERRQKRERRGVEDKSLSKVQRRRSDKDAD